MTLYIKYLNARLAAYSVQKYLKKEGWQQLSTRPWNRYNPDNTLWWIVPSTEWPAYKYGKLFFSPERAPTGCLFCGLHIEKGLDPSVAEAYSPGAGQRLIMKEDWAWFEFLPDLCSERLGSVVMSASEEANSPIVFRLEACFVDDPRSFDPQAPRPKWDTIIFESMGNNLELNSSQTPSGLLRSIEHSKSPCDLENSISRIPNSSWVWLDIFIGSLFMTIPADDYPDAWDAAQLWAKILSLWEPWFK